MKHNSEMLLLTILSSLVRLSRTYSTGAPPDVCTTFQPGHGSEPRDVGSLPYKVLLSSYRVSSGEKVTVSLTGSGFLTSTELKGFLMQVGGSVLLCEHDRTY